MLFLYPAYTHDWAQADRLSLAINFYDNGMNFFKPATHNLSSVNGITGVEFPIQSYIAALLGHLFGREHISICYRLLDITVCCTGLFFLFRTAFQQTRNFVLSSFPPLFILCSPVYTFYAGTYLPDAVAASVAFIGFYFAQHYFSSGSKKDMVWAVGLFTLAALIKTSLGYCLIAFIPVTVWKIKKNRKERSNTVALAGSALLSFSLLVGYYVYNAHLNRTYNSTLFTASINPFKSMSDINDYYSQWFLPLWMEEYFLVPQYFAAGLILPLTIYLIWRTGNKPQLYFTLLLLAGACCLFVLFGKQIAQHDYYFASIFLPAIGFLLLQFVISLHRQITNNNARMIVPSAFGIFTLALIFLSVSHLQKRLTDGYMPGKYGINWAAHGKGLLDKLGIPKNEKIAVLDEDAPNLALVYLDRKGYHIPHGTWIGDMSMTNDILNDLRVRILVCDGKLAKHIRQYDVATVWFFTPLYVSDDIAVFRKKRLPALNQ